MEFKHTQLDNGLAIVAEVNPAAASMAAGFFVQAGSRDETPEVSGISHFLEHMVFKGTPRRSPADVNRELDAIGAKYNAATSAEETVFYAAALPEFQTTLLDVLCDIMRPALRQEDFETEKSVILEEIAMLDDNPPFRVFEELLAAHFKGHPLANSVRGTAESIRLLKQRQMQEYFDDRYGAGNVTAVGVGDLDFDAFVEKISQLCGNWQAHQAAREKPPIPASQAGKIITDANVAREHIALMSAAPEHRDPQRYAAELLATILGDVTGSRLHYALVDPAIADEASTSYDPMDAAGGFLTFISADAGAAAQALQIAHEEMRKLQETGPTEKELAAAKNKIASSATLKGELPMGRLKPLWDDWVYRGRYIPLAKHLDTLLSVTTQQVLELARSCDLTSTTMVALGPLESL